MTTEDLLRAQKREADKLDRERAKRPIARTSPFDCSGVESREMFKAFWDGELSDGEEHLLCERDAAWKGWCSALEWFTGEWDRQNATAEARCQASPPVGCSTLNDGPTCARCDCSVSVRDGEEWEQGTDVCDHCAQEQAHTSNVKAEGSE